MDRAIRNIEKQVKGLTHIERRGATIQSNSEKIVDKARIIGKKRLNPVQVLDAAWMI